MMAEVGGGAEGSLLMAALCGRGRLRSRVPDAARHVVMRRRAGTHRAPTPPLHGPRLSSAPPKRRCAASGERERSASRLLAAQLERILAARALLLFRALPDHARKTRQRHQRLAGIGPFLELFDGDVIERLTAGALLEQCAGDVDHVRPAWALIGDRRAAMCAETARGLGRLVLVAGERGLARNDAEALLPASDIGRIGRAVRAAAGGRMIMPGPAGGNVDLEGDLAAEALAGGSSCGGCGFGHDVSSSSLRRQQYTIVIPGRDEVASPESIRPHVQWPDGFRARRSASPRNDGGKSLRRRQLVVPRVIRIPLLLAAVERRAVVRRDRIVVLQAPRQIRVGDEDATESDDIGVAVGDSRTPTRLAPQTSIAACVTSSNSRARFSIEPPY